MHSSPRSSSRDYVVLATPRSGSTYLCDALAGAGAGDPQEWFSRALIHHHAGEWGMRGACSTVQAPDLHSPAEYLDAVGVGARVDGILSVKVHWHQYQWVQQRFGADPLQIFGDTTRPAAVRIYRKDLVGQAVSSLIADTTHVFFQRKGEEPSVSFEYEGTDRSETVVYDFYEILRRVIRFAEDEEHWSRFVADRGLRSVSVAYESLVEDLTGTVRGVLDHLGIAARSEPASSLAKQATERNQEFSERFRAELRAYRVPDSLSEGMVHRLGLEGAAA
ncbi:Stf0 family sulfotransferase [Streptomyces sp. NPDC015345]|uniref:Stf0 family sulfotransferase n=1 Tax=Streptomyces sp. NPDC015345 TaxID=3364953 RepID=UPI0036FBFA51